MAEQAAKRTAIGTGTYAAQGGLAGALGVLVACRYAEAVPTASPAELSAITAVVMGLFGIGAKVARDLYYKRVGPPSLVSLMAVLGLVALTIAPGCAQMGGQEDTLQPVLNRTLLDASGKPIGEVRVSLGSELASRGCIALDVSAEGDTSFILQQDGSSDWSTVRGLVSIIPETVAVVLNPISTPIGALVDALAGRQPIEPPSEIHGCTGLFETESAAEAKPAGSQEAEPEPSP